MADRLRRGALCALCAALLAPLVASVPARAAAADLDKLDRTVFDDPQWGAPDADGKLYVVLHLDQPTVLDLYLGTGYPVGDPRPAARRALERVAAVVAKRQAPSRAFVDRTGATVLSTYVAATNGFMVEATRAQVEALTRTPGLARIYRAPELYPMLGNAVPTIGANRVLQELGVSGKGSHVAVIDTGIDYDHVSLGGKGGDSYQKNDPATVELNSFPTDKVIGGYDFAGRNYTGGNRPVPDGDPLDEAGHGTHVGGIVGGLLGNRQVPHGVAPDAGLVALKVFGARGGTNIYADAIEWAVKANTGLPVLGHKARVDVINMSLGSSWALGVDSAIGVTLSAVRAGIVVVASAGNSGNAAFVTGSPAASQFAVSVASTYASGQRTDKIQVIRSGETEDIEAVEADPSLTVQITGTGERRAPLMAFGTGCDDAAPHPDATGNIALVEYGGCNEWEKLDNIAKSGGVGAVVYNPAGGLTTIGVDWKEEPATIPAFMIPGPDGQRLRQRLDGGQAITAVLSPDFKGSLERDRLADVISPFSSRGPSRGGQFKPDVAAPGSNIVAPAMGSGEKPVTLSGTSMAGPMVAGVAALLIERLRKDGLIPVDQPMSPAVGLGAQEVAAMLVNYADAKVWQDANGGTAAPLAWGGSGRVNAFRTVRSDTIVTAGDIASFNYGIDAFDMVTEDQREFNVKNLGGAPKHYKTAVHFMDPSDQGKGVEFWASKEMFTVQPKDYATLNLHLRVTPDKLKPFTATGGQRVMVPGAGLNNAEYDAHLVVTEVDENGEPVPNGDVARVPIYILPRAASNLRLEPDPIKVSPSTGKGQVAVINDGEGQGNAELFALVGQDPVEQLVDPRINVENVGARVVSGAGGARSIEFAVVTRRKRMTPFDSRVHVLVDTDRNGSLDWEVYNDDPDFLLTGGRRASGEQWNILRRIAGTTPIQYTNVIYLQGATSRYTDANLNTRIIVLRADAAQLGYAPGQPIAFNAVVLHDTIFTDIRGATRNEPFDVVPDGAVGVVNNAVHVVGGARLAFDEANLGFGLDRWSVPLGGRSSTNVTLTRREGGTLGKVLAVFPMNLPVLGDNQVSTIEVGEFVPPPTTVPTDTPAATPTPTNTPGPTVPPTHTPIVIPTLRPTPTPTTGTGPTWRKVYLPKAVKSDN